MQAGIRFLIASDVHLGHKEKHAVRGDDSYRAFQQVIDYAKQKKVDFLLLGGDLFDQVNPSKQCYFKCLTILREQVFGNESSSLRVSLNGTPYRSNLDDPGLRVSLPIFTIHGNHDYPTNEFGKISACDLLQASNYVNYFGKHLDLRSIVIRPLIITKDGNAGNGGRIALYGLGYIKDQILNELFSEGKVSFQQPQGGFANTLCLFVLHQNRYKKGFRPGSPLHQSFNVQNIPTWINLVIWGHQHEAIYKLDQQYGRKIYQPGSTILTSYIESECGKKQCLLVETAPSGSYQLVSLPLNRSYRPMKCLSYQFAILKALQGDDFDFFACIQREIEQTLKEFQLGQLQPGQQRVKPIIRVKVQATGLMETVRARHVQMRFVSRVANGEKILQFWTRRVQKPVKQDDKDMVAKMKKKETLRFNFAFVDQMDSYCRNYAQKTLVSFLPKEGLTDMTSYLSRAESISPAEVIKKKCQEMLDWRAKSIKRELQQLNKEKQESIKRALKYNNDCKIYFMNGTYDQQFYSTCNSIDDFFALKETQCTEAKYSIIMKTIEEKGVSHLSQQQIMQDPSSKTHSAHSAHSAHSHSHPSSARMGKIQGIFQIGERSDSEDCCSRAERTEYDETGNKMRYIQAQDKMKKEQTGKRKRPGNINNVPNKQKGEKGEKEKASGLRSEQKNIKQVRFSNDFM